MTSKFSVGDTMYSAPARRTARAVSAFGGHETERSQRQAVVRLEIVQQATLAAIGEDFIMNVEEDFLREHFHLKTHLVTDAVGARQTTGVLPAQAIAEQATLIGQ